MTEINGPGGPEKGGQELPAWHAEAAEATERLRQAAGHPPDEPDEPARPAGAAEGPRRVVGTPSPAPARALLLRPEDEEKPPARELPSEPDNPRQAKIAERVVASCFLLAMVAGFGFIAAYIGLGVHSISAVLKSNLALGVSMAVAFLALGTGAVIWVRALMPEVELTEARKPLRSSADDKAAFKETFKEGADTSQFVKRPILRRTLIAATVPVAVAPIVLLRDMGPLPGTSLRHTAWKKGTRLVQAVTGVPVLADDFSTPGGILTVVPEGSEDDDDALAKATVLLVKLRPEDLEAPTVMNWTVNGTVAYSKICTHVGCPAALYEQTTHHILCPCHQSTFDAARGAKVIFGPAARPLPQLPITTNAEGYLVAQSDFHEPVGPSFWERG
jgi:ubiquinol-cytochrome c reductase iron-sulfur subunit